MIDGDVKQVAGGVMTYIAAHMVKVEPIIVGLIGIFTIIFTVVKIINVIMDIRLKNKELEK